MKQLRAIGFPAARILRVLCDGAGTPLRPAIMWSDQRAAYREAADLATSGEARCRSIDRQCPQCDMDIAAAYLAWRPMKPEIIAATEKLFFAKDWLAAQLTGGAQTISDALRSGRQSDGRTRNGGDGMTELPRKERHLSASRFPAAWSPRWAANRHGRRSGGAEVWLARRVPVYQGAIDTSMEWLCAAPLNATNSASLKLASAGRAVFHH